MRMYEFGGMTRRWLAAASLAAVLALAGGGGVAAMDAGAAADAEAAERGDDQNIASQIVFASPIEAYRQGKAAFEEGWYGLALPALRYADEQGVFGARLKLAKMYELGLGVPRNDAAAFELYKRLTDNNWELSSFHPAAPYIGQSLSALGVYYLNGIKELGIARDAEQAANHFTHAAEYFGDPRAQYELSKLLLAGDGVKKDEKRGVAWLYNAARKDYAPAQALLGQILWEGQIVEKRQMRALVLLTLAQENASPQDSEWISGIYKTVVAGSQPQDVSRAKKAVARWVSIYQPGSNTGSSSIVVRKEVRIGIAEDRDMPEYVGSSLSTSAMPNASMAGGAHSAGGVANASVFGTLTGPAGSVDAETRMWTGKSSFDEIDGRR
jgi:TPR repeat protein